MRSFPESMRDIFAVSNDKSLLSPLDAEQIERPVIQMFSDCK
jgi:hypothetical protein